MAYSVEKSIVFIVNPASASGKTARRFDQIKSLVVEKFPQAEFLLTQKATHAIELTRKAIADKKQVVVAVGGDGTISEVSAGFFDAAGRLLLKDPRQTKLGIIAAGSGSDFVKSTGIGKNDEQALQILSDSNSRLVDLGLCHFTDHQLQKKMRGFINISDIGIGGEVMHLLESEGKIFGPWLSYQLATIRSLLNYKNKNLTITFDEQEKRSGIFNGVIVANGKYFGSGMKIAPNAEIDDGFFDVVLLKEMTKLSMISKLGKLKNGTHIKDPAVEVIRCKKIKVELTSPASPAPSVEEKALLEVDGEPLGQCPVSFSIFPKALSLIDKIDKT